MVRETELSVSDFVYPMFIVRVRKCGTRFGHAGVSQFSVDEIILEARQVAHSGVRP